MLYGSSCFVEKSKDLLGSRVKPDELNFLLQLLIYIINDQNWLKLSRLSIKNDRLSKSLVQ